MKTAVTMTKPINKIFAHPKNPRLIRNEKYLEQKKSIEETPEMMDLRPVIIDEDDVILGGHQRWRACKELGWKDVPVMQYTREKHLKSESFTKFNKTYELVCAEIVIKDNTHYGEFDYDILANEWDYLPLTEYGVAVWETEPEEVEGLTDEDAVPEAPQDAITKLGDVWILGEHRVMCGDSTSKEAVEILMDGEKADICFTSPPYNAGKSEVLSGNTHTTDNKYNSYNDNQNHSEYLKLLIEFTNIALIHSEYLILNIQSLAGNKIALIDYLYQYKNNFIDVCIWDKGHGAPAMAKNVMTSSWEYLLFISSKDKASRAIPNADFRGNVSNIYRGKPQRNNQFSEIHAATFPVELPEWAIQFTKQNDIIFDSFLGTGTTLIAAEKTNRKCYGMELDPKYCDVIVKRWEDFTGKKAHREEDEFNILTQAH